MKELDQTTVGVFEDHCETGLFKIKFYLLGHVSEDLDKVDGVRWKHELPRCILL